MTYRIKYIDSIKGIAILLMLLGHCMSQKNMLSMWISSFNMPLFFIISGFLFSYRNKNNQEFQSMIKNKILKLMVPYFIFSLILAIFFCVLDFLNSGEFMSNLYKYVIRIIELKGIESLWFIPCLFITEIVFYLINNKFDKKTTYIMVLSIYFICAIVGYNKNDLWFSVLFKSGVALLFFAFGYIMQKYIGLYKFSTTFILLINIIYIILFRLNGFVGLGAFELNNIFLFVILGITGSVGIIFLMIKLENIDFKLLNFLGSNTIIILCTNNIIIEIIRLLDYKICGNELISMGLLGSFVLLIIVTLLEMLIIYISNKYLYYLFGKKKTA